MKFNILRDGVVTVCFLALLFLVAQKVKDDASETVTGRYRVVDGDSLALGGTRLRLLGIDAPELSQTCMRAGTRWNCGEAARERLAGLIVGGNVLCRGGRKDKYGRLLVTCYDRDTNINRAMVLTGMAMAFGDYVSEEMKARQAHAGLWAGEFARPADWRRAHPADMEEAPHVPSFLQGIFGGEG